VLVNVILGFLGLLSLMLLLWQWWVARLFPLHQRVEVRSQTSPLTLLKPLKGCDQTTEKCLRTWFAQQYGGQIQILFGVSSADDPVCDVVRKLLREFPNVDAQLIVCGHPIGANAKVSKLAELFGSAKHELIIISDADVLIPPDLLSNLVAPFDQPNTGLVNCFYEFANPDTFAMHWEAVAINCDFWSQVLQSRSLKPPDFALGAVMAVRRHDLESIGGFKTMVDCLADDYQLGNRISRLGRDIVLSPIVVQCWSNPMTWMQVWKHQLRWGRTIRVCQPLPYFFSILSNPTLWPVLWMAIKPSLGSIAFCAVALLARVFVSIDLQTRLTRASIHPSKCWVPLLKDILQSAIWFAAFAGNRIEWRGTRMRLRPDGTLVKA
jgi:ceramide glucosyltransferase